MQTNITYGERLRSIREELGLSQTDVGDALGLSTSRISQLERGNSIRMEDFGRLKRFYGITADSLFERKGGLSLVEERAMRLFESVLDHQQRKLIVDQIDSIVKNMVIAGTDRLTRSPRR